MFRERMTVRKLNHRGIAGVRWIRLGLALALAMAPWAFVRTDEAAWASASPELRVVNNLPTAPGETSEAAFKNWMAKRYANFQGAADSSSKAAGSMDIRPPGPNPIHGTLSTIVLLGGSNSTHTPNEFNELIFSLGTYFRGPTVDASGTRQGSLRDYALECSYGLLDIEGQVRGWFPSATGTGEAFIRSVVGAADVFVNFAQFDNDGPDGIPRSAGSVDDDGIVDFLIAVYSPDIAPANGTFNAFPAFETNDGVRVDHGFFVSEQDLFIPNEIQGTGPMAWGLAMTLGIPDHSDGDGSSVGTGFWNLADQGWRLSPPGFLLARTPAHIDAWGKWKFGWLTPQVATQAGTVQLRASAAAPDALRAFRKNDPEGEEYFLLEYKSANPGSIFDIGYPLGSIGRGFLLWHVDEAIFNNPLIDGEQFNADESHPFMMVEQADGQFDLQKNPSLGNLGDDGDSWPGLAGIFNNASTPNSKDYSSKPTGLSLSNFSLTSNTGGSVLVNFDTFAPTLRIVYPGSVPVTPIRDNLEIRWQDSDPDSNARVGFYYSRLGSISLDAAGLALLRQTQIDSQGRRIQGVIRENIPEDEATNRTVWNTLDPEVAPGAYFIYGSIQDENTLLMVRSQLAVQVNHDQPPVIQVIEPNGVNDRADESYTIRWIDSGDSDAVVRIYYDTDNNGRNGVEITTAPIPASDPNNFLVWDTRDVYPIPYWIYAEITKSGIPSVYDYSDGPVYLNHPPAIELLKPDHQGETAIGSYSICWNDADLAQDASITLYYNTTSSIAGAVPINATPLSEDDFTDCYLWNTGNVPPGCYFIIGLIDDGEFMTTSASRGTVCVEDIPPEIQVAVHDLTRVGQRIEATSNPTAILGIDANRAGTSARLESIDIKVRDLSRGFGSFDIANDLEGLFSSSSGSGIALYKDALAFASESQFVSGSILAASANVFTPLGIGEIVYQTIQVPALTLSPGDVVFLSGSASSLKSLTAISTLRINSRNALLAEYDLVEPRGDFIFANESQPVTKVAPLHEPIEITDLVRAASGALEIRLVLKESSPYRSIQSGARLAGNTDIALIQLARLPDFTTNGFFNFGDELIPIQDVQVINEDEVRIVPKTPPLLPNSSLGQDSGDDFFIVFRTSERIEFLDAFQVLFPANGVLTSNGRKGNAVDTQTVEANPPTFIDPPVFPEGPPATPIPLREPLEPWPVFRISMSDNGQQVFLKSVRVNFHDFGGFTPSSDLLPMAVRGGGVSLFRDNGDGFFNVSTDPEITLAAVPQITGTGVRSINLELSANEFPLPDTNDRAPDLFVVIRPSEFILSGDEFKVAIPTGGIIYDYRNGVPAVISSGENALSELYRAETNQIQVDVVDLTSFGQRIERTSDLIPVVGFRIWDPGNLGPVFNTLESIDFQIIPVGGTITSDDFLPIASSDGGGVSLLDPRWIQVGPGSISLATDTAGLISFTSEKKNFVYQRTAFRYLRGAKVRTYISGAPGVLEPFIVAGDIRINGDVARQIRGYGAQVTFPPQQGGEGTPLDFLYQPHEALDVTDYFNRGIQNAVIELIARVDTGLEPDPIVVYGGNTSLYLVEIPQSGDWGKVVPGEDSVIKIDSNQSWNQSSGNLQFKVIPLENTILNTSSSPPYIDHYIALRTSETIDYLDSFKVKIPAGGVLTSRGRVGRELVTQTLTCNPPTFIAGIAASPSQTIRAPNFPMGAYAIGTSDNGLEDQAIESIEVHVHDLFGFSRTDLNSIAEQHGGVGLYEDRDGNGIYSPIVDSPILIKPTQFLGINPLRVILEPQEPWPLPDTNDSVADLFVGVNPSSSLETGVLFSVEIPKRGIKFTNLRSGESAFTSAFSSEVNQGPFIDILTPRAGGEVAGDSFRILWRDSDPDDDAQINLYFSARGDIRDEVELITANDVFPVRNGKNISENDETDALNWNTSKDEINIVPGERYYVYATIRDKDSVFFARSPGYVRVTSEGLLSYVKMTSYGGVYSPGGFNLLGSPPLGLNPIAEDIELLRNEDGYYILDRTGHIYRFGKAAILPSIIPPVGNAVDMELTPDEQGAFVLLDNGEVRTVGTARFYGQAQLTPGSARDMAASPSGAGYVILDQNGQTYSYGDARSFSTAVIPGGLAVDIELTPSGRGAFILDAFGGIHSYGDAPTDLSYDIYGFDIARSLAVLPGDDGGVMGLLVLDGFGGVQSVGEINTMIDYDFAPVDIFRDIEAVNIGDVYKTSVIDVIARLYRAIQREDLGTIRSLFSTRYQDSHGNDLKRALEFYRRNFDIYEWQSRGVIGGLENAVYEVSPLSARAILRTVDLIFAPTVISQDLTRGAGTTIQEIVVPFSQRVFIRKRPDGRGFQLTVYDVDHSQTFDIQTNPAFDDVIFRKFFEKDGDEVGDMHLNHESEAENNAYAFVTEERFSDASNRFDNGTLEIFWYDGLEILVSNGGSSETPPVTPGDNESSYAYEMVNEGGVYRIVKGSLYQILPAYSESTGPVGFRFDLPGPWWDTRPRDSDFRFTGSDIAIQTLGGGVVDMTEIIGAASLDDVGQEDIDILTEADWEDTVPASPGNVYVIRRPDAKTWGKIIILGQADDYILFDWEYRTSFIIKNPPNHIKPGAP